VLTLPVMLVGLWQVLNSSTGERDKKRIVYRYLGWLILLVVLTFGIVRNIPFYPFTLIAP